MILPAVLLLVTVWFNGTPISCVADTGASQTLVNRSTAAALPALLSVGKSPLAFTGIDGRGVAADMVLAMRVATRTLAWEGGVPIGILPDQELVQGCLLGADLLGQQPVVFDWSRGEVFPLGAAL